MLKHSPLWQKTGTLLRSARCERSLRCRFLTGRMWSWSCRPGILLSVCSSRPMYPMVARTRLGDWSWNSCARVRLRGLHFGCFLWLGSRQLCTDGCTAARGLHLIYFQDSARHGPEHCLKFAWQPPHPPRPPRPPPAPSRTPKCRDFGLEAVGPRPLPADDWGP